MDKKELELLIENFPDKFVLRRYRTYIENKDKSFTEIHNKYVREIKKAIKNGNIGEDTKKVNITTDAYRKSIIKIEEKGIESIFFRKDIVNYAMFINPICIADKVNMSKIKNYIVNDFKLRLESGKDGNYKFVFGERFGLEETYRKELIEHLAICKKKVIDIKSLKRQNDVCIIDTYARDKKHLHIKCYKYNGYRIKLQFEDIYESKYLESYMTKVEKGIIDYNVMKRRSIISNQCRKKIKKGLESIEHNGKNYLVISPFSAGIINAFIYNNDNISFELVDGNIKSL